MPTEQEELFKRAAVEGGGAAFDGLDELCTGRYTESAASAKAARKGEANAEGRPAKEGIKGAHEAGTTGTKGQYQTPKRDMPNEYSAAVQQIASLPSIARWLLEVQSPAGASPTDPSETGSVPID